jgi:hypothetical protein
LRNLTKTVSVKNGRNTLWYGQEDILEENHDAANGESERVLCFTTADLGIDRAARNRDPRAVSIMSNLVERLGGYREYTTPPPGAMVS